MKELSVISPERTSLVLYQAKRKKPGRVRMYRRIIKKLSFICGLEFGIIAVLAVMNYILQAGPIW